MTAGSNSHRCSIHSTPCYFTPMHPHDPTATHLLLHHISHQHAARLDEPAQGGGRGMHGVHLCARSKRLHQHLDQV